MYTFFKHKKNENAFEDILTLPYLITYLLMFLNIVKAQNPTFSWTGSREGSYNGNPETYPTYICLDLNIAFNNATDGLSLASPGEIIFKDNYRTPDCRGNTRTYSPSLDYSPCFSGYSPYSLSTQLVCDGKFKIDFTMHRDAFYDGSGAYVYPCLVNSFTSNGCPIEYMSFADQAERKRQQTLRTIGIAIGSTAGTLMLCGLICYAPKVIAKIKDRRHREEVADQHKKYAAVLEADALLSEPRPSLGYGTENHL